VSEDLGAHVVHRLLAHPLHDANLDVLRQEIEDQHAKIQHANPQNPTPGA
jgi:hypothetical protein